MAAPVFASIGAQLQGSSSAMNVAAPSGVTGASDEMLIVKAFVDSATISVTAMPSGWAHAPDSPVAGPDNHRQHILYKVQPAVTGTYDFTLSGSVYRNAACERITGVDPAAPFDVTQSAGSNTSATTTPDVADTTTGADRLLTWGGTNWSGGTWTPPSGFTEDRDTGDGVNSSAHKTQAVAGSTGAIVGTCTGSDKRTAWMGAIKGPSGGATDLVVADARSASQADNVALIQQHNLTVADATSAAQADNVTLTQVHNLLVQDALAASQADNVTLTQVHNLVVQDAVAATQADNVVLTTGTQLTVQDATATSTVDPVTLTQVHNLAVADAVSSSTADSIQLTQVHNLVVQDAVIGTRADNVVLGGGAEDEYDWEDLVNDRITLAFITGHVS